MMEISIKLRQWFIRLLKKSKKVLLLGAQLNLLLNVKLIHEQDKSAISNQQSVTYLA